MVVPCNLGPPLRASDPTMWGTITLKSLIISYFADTTLSTKVYHLPGNKCQMKKDFLLFDTHRYQALFVLRGISKIVLRTKKCIAYQDLCYDRKKVTMITCLCRSFSNLVALKMLVPLEVNHFEFHCADLGPFHWYGLTLLPEWINDHMLSKVWDEITYPFICFNFASL